MIQEYTRLARPYFVILAIVTVGRWAMGNVFHVPFEKGTSVLSIVTLTTVRVDLLGGSSRDAGSATG